MASDSESEGKDSQRASVQDARRSSYHGSQIREVQDSRCGSGESRLTRRTAQWVSKLLCRYEGFYHCRAQGNYVGGDFRRRLRLGRNVGCAISSFGTATMRRVKSALSLIHI